MTSDKSKDKPVYICNIRLTGGDKYYYKKQLQLFANHMNDDVTSVAFGKQDIRGGISITLTTGSGCVPMQMHFSSKDMMLGYVIGYNQGKDLDYNKFKTWA